MSYFLQFTYTLLFFFFPSEAYQSTKIQREHQIGANIRAQFVNSILSQVDYVHKYY